MKTYWDGGVLEGGELSASRLGRFNPRERTPGTHWIGGWVGSLVSVPRLISLFSFSFYIS
jgi:hypothetical protein